MRPRAWTTAALAAGTVLVGCTSSTTAPGTSAAAVSPSDTAASAPSVATSTSAVTSSSTSRSAAPTSRAPSATAGSSTPPPSATTYLLSASEVGAGFEATTKLDASIPSLCGGAGAADRRKPTRSTAQIGFFDSARRLLIAEKVNTYADRTTASQVNSVVLAFDSCGSAAKYNGRKATFSAPRDLADVVMKQVDSGSERDLRTSQAALVFEAFRKGTTLVQLTFTSIGGTPPKDVVDQITLQAAQKLH